MSFYSLYSMFLLVTQRNYYFSHLHALLVLAATNHRVSNKIKKVRGAKVKFDQLIIRKIIKIVATRCYILRLKYIKFAQTPLGSSQRSSKPFYCL